jgi:hypothetical protein
VSYGHISSFVVYITEIRSFFQGEGEPKPGKSEDEQPLIPQDEEEDIGYALTVMSKAEYPDPDEVVRKEDLIYFYPSSAESEC